MIHPYTYAGTFKTVAPTTVTIKSSTYNELVERSNALHNILNPKDTIDMPIEKKKNIFDTCASISCSYYGVNKDTLSEQNRRKSVIKPRQVAMYMCHVCGLSLSEIGRMFKRDHTTALHSIRVVKNDMEQNTKYYNEVTYIYSKIAEKLSA